MCHGSALRWRCQKVLRSGPTTTPRRLLPLLYIYEAAKLAQRSQREPRHRDHWPGCRRTLCHPHRQRSAAAIRLFDYKVRPIAMNQAPENNDAFSGARMMRIMDHSFEQMFLCIMSLA
jgi:hypothetical protein